MIKTKRIRDKKLGVRKPYSSLRYVILADLVFKFHIYKVGKNNFCLFHRLFCGANRMIYEIPKKKSNVIIKGIFK